MFVCQECGATHPMPGHCGVDGAPLAALGDDVLLGQTVGAYRIARLLGIGGMGRVYKGVHPHIGSRVAIKVLSRECSDRPDLVERFFAEARAVNLIRHESIVNVLDLSSLPDGRPYIVMEYLDGSPLAAIIDNAQHSGQRLPLGGIARLCVEVLDALGAAHAKGIIHRDLKPDNIFVTPAGRAKVLDFGIAKLQPELGGSSTHTGSLLGTPHYMSSEQASGRPLDPRADLYAIGVILFECATLQRPFSASSLFDLLRMHIEVPPPFPRGLRPDMPLGMEQVILTALSKQPEQRFGSALAMSTALQHATAQLPSEHWSPILPASASRASSAGVWVPTPPASWAGTGRVQPDAEVPPTQRSGEPKVEAPLAKSVPASRKGLWIAVGTLLLAGAGITAVALRSDDKPIAAPDKRALSRDPIAQVPVVADAAPSVPDAVGASEADPDYDIFGELGAPELTPEQAAEFDKLVADMLAAMPAYMLAKLPPSLAGALKKYGSWSKIPQAERYKLIPEAMGVGTASLSELDGSATPPVQPPPPGPKGPDGWIHYTKVRAPGGAFDATKVDAQKYLAWTIAEAKKLYPDAILFRIDTKGLYPSGIADLTAVDQGELDFRFLVPSRVKNDPKRPIGGKQDAHCIFRYSIEVGGPIVLAMDGWSCREKVSGAPHCSFKQVWQKAIAKGAPANAVADVSFYDGGDQFYWYFRIDDPDHHFSERFEDDCK